jgi:hypothetical protein
MSEPLDMSHNLDQPTLPEAMLIEDLALAAVSIIAPFVPGGTELRAVASDAIDVWEKDAPTLIQAIATILKVAGPLLTPAQKRAFLDGETIALSNDAAELAAEIKFGPRP